MPKVSVIIPTIRRPLIVQTAIAGVLRQTFTDLEVVVVIDGPDPETADALRRISDPRFFVLELSANVGLAEARNVGVRASKGEWIAFLDDDDEWMPEKLELQVAEAARIGGHEVLVVSRYFEKTDSMERVWPEVLPVTRERFSEYLFVNRGQLLPSTYFVSSSLVKRIPFTKGLRHIEDLDWLLRLASDPSLRIGAVAKPVAIYNNFAVPGRESRQIPWETYYLWAVSQRRLFTSRAFSLYLVKSVLPLAREMKSPFRVRFHILATAILLGSFRPEVFFYFFASAFFSRETKRKMRELTSARARRARVKKQDTLQ